ncbi:MAG: hypothetical protein UH687_01925 [Bacteroidaceae bacterium]|jgi:hypothetical protein|nr:hypothetical protein [Bacteroidaceae bacterium]
MRKINIANDARRDAEVAFGNKGHKETIVYKTTTGSTGRNERRLKATMPTTEAALLEAYGDALAEALVTGDPEVDMERIGLKLEGLKKVYITPQQKVAYGVSLNEHVYLPDGTEKEVRPDSTTTANIALEGVPLRWTGKLIPKDKAMRMFMFKRSYQVQHINGLTFDFLYDMAKKLAEANAMMLVGGGAKGNEPLVMSNGGTPYRAFLEGRVNGESYALILRLTNLELKEIPTK